VVLKQIIIALSDQAAEIDKVKTGGGVLKFLKLRFLMGYFDGKRIFDVNTDASF
jgi:hypothetical protein